MYLKNSFVFLVCIFLMHSCANVVSPEGGPKDTTPPFAVSANPKDSTLNFNSKIITINFSENIQIKDQKNISISPPLKNGFEVDAFKRKLTIKVKNLQPNTTYTINAQNAIADITEGNLMPELKYIFSTGNTIDTGTLKGKVIASNDIKPVKNAMVGLYINYTDSSIFKDDPDYRTFTDEQGNFRFENIKTGLYKIVAIADKNNNLRWETGEGLAFEGDLILIDSSDKRIVLRLFPQTNFNAYLISAVSNVRGVYEFEFDHQPVKDIEINQEDPSTDKKVSYYTLYDEESCFKPSTKKLLITSLHPKDSAHFNYTINNTIYRTSVKVSRNRELLKTESDFYTLKIKSNSLIYFNRSIDTNTINKTSIIIFQDSIKINIPVKLNSRGFTIPELKPGNYKMLFQKGAITDIFGIENDSFQIILKILAPDELQTLMLKTDSTFTSTYQIIISNDNFYCKREIIQGNKNYLFNELLPGTYKILVFENSNGNLFLDNGDFFNKVKPERVLYYKELEIKPLFDIEEVLTIMAD